jgi:hypothetical protein
MTQDVTRENRQRDQAGDDHRPAHAQFAKSEPRRLQPVQQCQRHAMVGIAEGKHDVADLSGGEQFMHGMPFIVDQQLRVELIQPQEHAADDRQHQQDDG